MKKYFVILFFLVVSSYIYGQNYVDVNKLKAKFLKESIDTSKVMLSLKIAQYYSTKNPDSSYTYFNKALKISKRNSLNYEVSEAVLGIAIYFESIGKYEKSIMNLFEALAYFENVNNNEKIALVNSHIGYNYSRLYKDDLALEHYLKSLSVYKEEDHKIGIAKNYRSIGNLYYYQGDFDSSKNYYEDALKIYLELKNKRGIAESFTYLGNVASDNGEIVKGLEYYNKSNVLLEELDDVVGVAGNYNNIGYNNLELKDYKNALIYFEKALFYLEKTSQEEFKSLIYLNIGGVYNKLKNYNKAIINCNKSLKLAEEFGNLKNQADNLEILSEAYKGLGDSSKAMYYIELCEKVKDSIIATNQESKVQLLTALNELDKSKYTIDDLSNKSQLDELKIKSEKRIISLLIIGVIIFLVLTILLFIQDISKRKAFNILKLKNEEIKLMNNEIWEQKENLKHLNSTKDKLFSIIGHDLRSPFNSISGFTDLLIENNEIYDSEKRLKYLNVIKKSTSNTSELLDNLLNWSLLQSGRINYVPQKIDLKIEVEKIISFVRIQAIHKKIKIENNVKHGIFVLADLNMMNTILRNLISNALKFTESGGEIKINAEKNLDFVKIAIKDNGIGIPEDTIKNLFVFDDKYSSVGTDNEIGSGLGLILCKDFVEKHEGELYVKSKLNVGSVFTFTLPVWVS